MKGLGLYPPITKDYILKRISQEEIMNHYYEIPVTRETLMSNSISSRYRNDTNPSCNYFYNINGKLRIKDWTTGETLDIFDVAAKELGITTNKQGFIKILHNIAKVFRLNKYVDFSEVLKYDKEFNRTYRKTNKTKSIIRYKVILRKPNYHDISYWGEGGIINYRGIFFIREIRISVNHQPFKFLYSYDPKDPCYAYYQKDKKKYINLWKFYFPIRIKGDKRGNKFYSNGSFIQGLQYIKPARILIITKSFKDVKVFNAIVLEAVALASESTPIDAFNIFFFKFLFDYIIINLDYDRTGIVMTQFLRKEYRLPYFFFTGNSKDAFEYVTNNGQQALKNIVQSLYDTYKEDIIKYEPKIINFQ